MTENPITPPAFEGWAIVEVMGHRTRPGFVTEVEVAGGKLLRVDIPTVDGDVTEFYGTASIYSLRPCSEEIAREAASERYGALRKPVNPMTYRDDEQTALPAPDDADFDEDDGVPY